MTDHPIYHITHVENLASIIEADRLWCDAQRIAKGLANTNIGYSHIKQRRFGIPCQFRAVVRSGITYRSIFAPDP